MAKTNCSIIFKTRININRFSLVQCFQFLGNLCTACDKEIIFCVSNSRSESETSSPKPKHRQKRNSRKHHSPCNYKGDKFIYDEKHIAKYKDKARMTPPLPDLRIDFFNESMDGCQQQQQQHHTTTTTTGVTSGEASLFVPVSLEKRGSVCLNKCLREVGAQLEANNATSPINVTTNPLENSVHFGGGGRKAPQATIVVQQPSFSLDHSNVSTILLKNGSEFLSNVEGGGSSVIGIGANNNKLTSLKKQKEDNMKQLLDVANNLTLEEIHDFEMRYVDLIRIYIIRVSYL